MTTSTVNGRLEITCIRPVWLGAPDGPARGHTTVGPFGTAPNAKGSRLPAGCFREEDEIFAGIGQEREEIDVTDEIERRGDDIPAGESGPCPRAGYRCCATRIR